MIFFTLCCVHILFFSVSSESVLYGSPHFHAKTNASAIFAGLLRNVIKVNEMRLDAMNHLTRLQERTITRYDLRSKPAFQAESGNRQTVILILRGGTPENLLSKIREFVSNVKNKLASKESIDNTEDSVEDENRELNDNYRRRNEIFCVKTAAKLCRKNCIRAYRDNCLTFRCAYKMKRRARTACKRTCKTEFNRGKYEASDSE